MRCRYLGHRWRTMTGGRGLVRWERCARCRLERMVKGREPMHWRRIRQHPLALALLRLDLAAIAAVLLFGIWRDGLP